MKIDLISIVIPNYNHEPFLRSRLESVFSQTYQNFEVILLDDCSTDNSVQLLQTYANHPKVSHFIVNETNSGSLFRQWEKGIELAKGEYVWIAESDDFCEVNFLEKITKILNPSVAIAYCNSIIVDSKGDIIKKNDWLKKLNKSKWSENHIENGKEDLNKYLRFQNMMSNASAVIFKRKAALEVKIPKEYYFCGDWFYWCALAKKGNIAFLSLYLNYFRRHETTTRSTKDFQVEVKRFKEYISIISEHSSIAFRVLNIRKYEWIIDDWIQKTSQFGKYKLLSAPFPVELYVLLYFRIFQNKFIWILR